MLDNLSWLQQTTARYAKPRGHEVLQPHQDLCVLRTHERPAATKKKTQLSQKPREVTTVRAATFNSISLSLYYIYKDYRMITVVKYNIGWDSSVP